MSNDEETAPDPDPVADGGHLENVQSGAGCVEVWEQLSEQRAEGNGDD